MEHSPHIDGVVRSFRTEVDRIDQHRSVEKVDEIARALGEAEAIIGHSRTFDHMWAELSKQYLFLGERDRALDIIDEIGSPVAFMEAYHSFYEAGEIEYDALVKLGVRTALAQDDPEQEREVLVRLKWWSEDAPDRKLANQVVCLHERAHQRWRRGRREEAGAHE